MSQDPVVGLKAFWWALVRLAPGHPARVARAAAVPVSQALARALGDPDPDTLTQITTTLAALARRLQPAEPGPIPRTLTRDPDARRRRPHGGNRLPRPTGIASHPARRPGGHDT